MTGKTAVWQPQAFGRFEDAYLAVLGHVTRHAEHASASRGNRARECLNISFVLTNPRDRLVCIPDRRANIVFCFAEALWYLQGRDDLEMIAYYAPGLARFSADGRTLTGSAYGPKLRAPGPGGRSQWDQVLSLLAADPGTKRAVMTIFHPGELDDPANPDVSCTLALQFLIRGHRLHTIAYLRANDAVTGLLCDVFSFTLIAEYTAGLLGAGLGTYGHHAGSMHINDYDQAKAQAITSAPRIPAFPVQAMPPTRPADLDLIAGLEQDLRLDRTQMTPGRAGTLGLAPYWQQVILLFEAYRQITHHPGTAITAPVLDALDPAYRWLLSHRWPAQVPDPAGTRPRPPQ